MALNILIAPSGFKESLQPDEVADYIELGVLRALPDAKIKKIPLVDGGEGFARALARATGGTLHGVTVTGPIGDPVEAHYGILGNRGPKTAVMEMAAAAGLRLVPREARDPLKTTTYGVGELIKAALDEGAERIIIGCGDSGTADCGAGAAQALGVRLLDGSGKEIGWGGGELARLERIEMGGRDPRIGKVQIDVACNWHDLLCGPNGASRVYGPQKGATPETVERLVSAMDHFADVIQKETGINVRVLSASGSGGGLATGVHVFLNGVLHPRYEIVMQYLALDDLLREADLVITAEGRLDFQTTWGKIPAEVARRAKVFDRPVIALVGTIGDGAHFSFGYGIESFSTILEKPTTLADAIKDAPELLARAAERVLRLFLVGQRVQKTKAVRQPASGMVRTHLYENPEEAGVDSAGAAMNAPSDFLGVISRELRTPLNLIMGHAALIKDRVLGEINPAQEKAAMQVMTHAQRLFKMIDGLMAATRIEAEKVALEGGEQLYSDKPVTYEFRPKHN